MKTQDLGRRREGRREIAVATDFRPLLEESDRLAREESIRLEDLEEMDAINRMRVVAESIKEEQYVLHSATSTP